MLEASPCKVMHNRSYLEHSALEPNTSRRKSRNAWPSSRAEVSQRQPLLFLILLLMFLAAWGHRQAHERCDP